MLRGFRPGGGLARSGELTSILAGRSAHIGTLARWIVQGEVIHLDWQHDTWLPVFQFGRPEFAPSAAVKRVLDEFRGVLDPWDSAYWFASPSAALGGRTPAQALEADAELVFEAARLYRYGVDA